MSHFNADTRTKATALVALYPEPRSALIPLCHLAQEQDGWLTPEAIEDIADLCEVTSAEVRGAASFYDMLHLEPVGTYVIAVCTNIACLLGGALELLEHAEGALGMRAGGTTPDGVFTLHEAECLADCDHVVCVQVNHRYVGARVARDLRHAPRRPALRAAGRGHPPARHARAGAPQRRAPDRPCRGGGRARGDGPGPGGPGDGGCGCGQWKRQRGSDVLMAITDAPKIITSRLGYEDSYTMERYLATGGYEGLRKALTMTPEAVAAEVDAASLLGRGGAGFPAGRKWSMMRKNPVTYLVINGDESEPATFKDHLLIERDPHQILEGVLISAYALQVSQAFVYVRGEFALGLERLQSALNEAYAHGMVGSNIVGSGFSLDVVVHPGAGAYICGEETAMLESLEGKRGFPRIKPPYFPAAIGLYGEPTVVNNVETMSNIPWIVINGGAAFAALGEGRSTGTRLFALGGHVRKPGAYELEMVKTTFRDLVYAPVLGGGIRGSNTLKAFIPGGVSAPWFGPDNVDLPLGQDEVGDAGSMLGSGSVVVMDSDTCMVRAAWRITKFFSRESCGQCTPCREGSGWLERILYRIEKGSGREEDLDLLMDLSDNISPGLHWPPQQTTICVLGPSIPSSIASGIRMFRDEFLVHVKEGGCPFD